MDIAQILTRVLGRSVKYRDVPMAMFAKAATAQGFPLFETSQVRHYLNELREGVFAVGAPTDHVQLVGKRTPETFESIARRYIADPALIHPDLSVGTKLGALALMMRMMATRVPNLDAWEKERGHPLLSRPRLAQHNDEWRASADQQQLNLLRSVPM